jgi:hypothetical protein
MSILIGTNAATNFGFALLVVLFAAEICFWPNILYPQHGLCGKNFLARLG